MQFEEIAPHADGPHFYVSNKFPLRHANGVIHAICGISTDITEWKKAEKAFRESEERFRQVVEMINEVFWLSNPEKTEILYVSPAYETIWGRSCESLYVSSQDWLDAIYSEDRDRVLEAALSKQVSGDYDERYRIVRPDGSIRWIRDRAFPVRDEAGNVYRLAGIAEDITAQGRAHSESYLKTTPAKIAQVANVKEAKPRESDSRSRLNYQCTNKA